MVHRPIRRPVCLPLLFVLALGAASSPFVRPPREQD